MKKIQSLMILGGITLALFALGATGAKGQTLSTTNFEGTFTLPFEAQWGTMTLPAGEYSLQYGPLFTSGPNTVAVIGKAKGSPRGWIVARAAGRASASKSQLVCTREGNRGYVRALEMPEIGESASFALPHGVRVRARVVAGKQNHNGNPQLAEARTQLVHVPVIPSVK